MNINDMYHITWKSGQWLSMYFSMDQNVDLTDGQVNGPTD